MRVLPCGAAAVLAEVADTAAALALRAAVQALVDAGVDPWRHVVGLVTGARTLLVRIGGPEASVRSRLAAGLAELAPEATAQPTDDGSVVALPVRYDGPDLDEVAALTGMTTEEVVRAHTGMPWRVGFGGFAPGFAYLVDGDPRLAVPRRAEPRAAVPAGAVALGGGFSGVYPRESPGGWHLLGTTDVVLWDVDRDPPALLTPGTTVRFVDVTDLPVPAAPNAAFGSERTGALARSEPSGAFETERLVRSGLGRGAPARALEVLDPGYLTLVEDLGRPGLGDLGVSPSGAADRAAYALAGRLVGQEPGAAALEVLLGGLAVRALGDLAVAVTGATVAMTLDGRAVPFAAPVHVPSGAVLRLGAPARGLRTYLAVRGGVDVPEVLGSRSHDTLAGLGPLPVRAGDVLPVGSPPPDFPVVEVAPQPSARDVAGPVVLTMTPGPRVGWCADPTLLERERTVGGHSDRVGLRLTGGLVPWADAVRGRDLPSEGVVRGAVQLPPGGEPVVFLADHPVTGGYPVVAVLTEASADAAAQLRPGDVVRLRWAQRGSGGGGITGAAG